MAGELLGDGRDDLRRGSDDRAGVVLGGDELAVDERADVDVPVLELDTVRHAGREYGVVLDGRLTVTVGFETYELGQGDSIFFNSDEPHVLANNTDEPATAIWFVLGRRQSDPRQPTFDSPGGGAAGP